MNKRMTPEIDDTGDEIENDINPDTDESRPILYFTAPLSMHNSDTYNQLLGRVYANFSYMEIHDAKNEWVDLEMWLSNWLTFSNIIDILVFTSDENGFVGRGIYTELITVLPSCKIIYLSPNGEFIPYECITLQLFNQGLCWIHYKKVIIITDTTH